MKLTKLSLSWNGLGDEGVIALISSAKISNLRYLSLNGNQQVSREKKKELERILTLKHSYWFELMITLCSVGQVPRIGFKSNFRKLPRELVEKFASTFQPQIFRP